MKPLQDYECELRRLVELRKGKLDEFLLPQIREAARCQRMMDRLDDELDNAPLTSVEVGSMAQMKTQVNPLLAVYEKMSRTMKLHLSALGLNYDATPSKVAEAEAINETSDPLVAMMREQKI